MEPNQGDAYINNANAIFLDPNTSHVLREIRSDASLSHISLRDIKKFQQALTEESKYKEFKLLRGRKRYLSHRQWISFSPGIYPTVLLSYCLPNIVLFTQILFFSPLSHQEAS